jgi:hypothetical protein
MPRSRRTQKLAFFILSCFNVKTKTMYCDDLFLQTGGASAGIINFGGDIRGTGNLLRVNGHMQSALNSTTDGVGNVFYVDWPIQIDTLAWNTTGNGSTELEVLVGNQRRSTFFFQQPGVTQLQNPIQLTPGSMVSLRVRNFYGPIPGPTQLSLYTSSI